MNLLFLVREEELGLKLLWVTSDCGLEINACYYERVVKKTVAMKITKAIAIGMLETSSFLIFEWYFQDSWIYGELLR